MSVAVGIGRAIPMATSFGTARECVMHSAVASSTGGEVVSLDDARRRRAPTWRTFIAAACIAGLRFDGELAVYPRAPDGVPVTIYPPTAGTRTCQRHDITRTSAKSAPTPVRVAGMHACERPECRAAHERAVEAAHRRAVDGARVPPPPRDPEVVMLALARSSDPERRADIARLLPWNASGVFRSGRSKAKLDGEHTVYPRERRDLAPDEVAEAIALLRAHPARRTVDRRELTHAAWLELVNPTVRVASRERRDSLARRVRKAVDRAYETIRPRDTDEIPFESVDF